MGLRVRDAGGSEGRAVMVRIGVQTLLHAKAGQLPAGLSSRENLSAKQKQEFVDMTGALTTPGASLRSLRYRTGLRLQVRIVKVW